MGIRLETPNRPWKTPRQLTRRLLEVSELIGVRLLAEDAAHA